MQAALFGVDDFVDATTGEKVPFKGFDSDLVKEILSLAEDPLTLFSVDVESTNLSPFTKETNLTSQQRKRGAEAAPRCRTAQIAIYREDDDPLLEAAFDLDQMTEAQRAEVANALLSGNFLAHNGTFDLNFLRWLSLQAGIEPVDPKSTIDTMLLARILYPKLLADIADALSRENKYPDGTYYDTAAATFAINLFMQERSGTSMADLAFHLLNEDVDKTYQKPGNWTEPFLTQAHYDYAMGDPLITARIFRALIIKAAETIPGLPRDLGNLPFMQAYNVLRTHDALVGKAGINLVKLVERQTLIYPKISSKGMPVSEVNSELFKKEQAETVEKLVNELVSEYPDLAPHKAALTNMDKGLTAVARQDISEVLIDLGVPVTSSAKSGTPQVGEKDLRKAGAANIAPEFFNKLIGAQKAKKMAQMADSVLEYAQRAPDGRLHPLFGITTNTLRLAVKEPNTQQFPGKQSFRNLTERSFEFKIKPEMKIEFSILFPTRRPSPKGTYTVAESDFVALDLQRFVDGDVRKFKIVSVDFSALDMRVGAACALRAQQKMAEIWITRDEKFEMVDGLFDALDACFGTDDIEELKAIEKEAFENRQVAKEKLKSVREKLDAIGTRKPTPKERDLFTAMAAWSNRVSVYGLAYRLSQVRQKAIEKGVPFWGSLQEAFKIKGMDIHTWTTLSMLGQDPVKEFEGLNEQEIAEKLEVLKKALADKRKTGKVGNLSLLYAMQTFGLVDAAAKNYNIHWQFDEADKIRMQWLDSYPEIDLWHIWTALNVEGRINIPSPENGGQLRNQKYWISQTLVGRKILATGLNAALSYEDQATGADILGLALVKLHDERPDVFEHLINQVHDEVVAEFPEEHTEEYTKVLSDYLCDAAHVFTDWNPMDRSGVQVEVGPAIGNVWIKD